MNTDPPIQLDPIDLPPPPEPQVTLEATYDAAMMGVTIHPDAPPRVAYSLSVLARIRSRQGNRSVEHAQQDVAGMVQDVIAQHGDRAPLFIDDMVFSPPAKPKSRIIKPGGLRF